MFATSLHYFAFFFFLVSSSVLGHGLTAMAASGGPDVPAIKPDIDGILFSIGKEDGENLEFEEHGWEGISEFECDVGLDCLAARFPMRLHAPSAYYWDYKAVQRVTIYFRLVEDIPSSQLALARAGDETSLIELDKQKVFTVTGEMLGSSGGGKYGRFVLNLGTLSEGLHSLTISVADDGQGNGRHALDAIVLKVAAAPDT